MGADDQIRQLSLLRVETAMIPVSESYPTVQEPAIARDHNLRHALSLLLQSGVHRLTVRDGDNVVGVLTLEQIRDSTQRSGVRSQESGDIF